MGMESVVGEGSLLHLLLCVRANTIGFEVVVDGRVDHHQDRLMQMRAYGEERVLSCWSLELLEENSRVGTPTAGTVGDLFYVLEKNGEFLSHGIPGKILLNSRFSRCVALEKLAAGIVSPIASHLSFTIL